MAVHRARNVRFCLVPGVEYLIAVFAGIPVKTAGSARWPGERV
jgi:hypothetical protein